MEDEELFADPIILGAVAGVIGNIPKTILTITFYYFGWVRYTFSQLAAGLFMKQEVLSNPLGQKVKNPPLFIWVMNLLTYSLIQY